MISIRFYGDQRQPSFEQAVYPGFDSDVHALTGSPYFWERRFFLNA